MLTVHPFIHNIIDNSTTSYSATQHTEQERPQQINRREFTWIYSPLGVLVLCTIFLYIANFIRKSKFIYGFF